MVGMRSFGMLLQIEDHRQWHGQLPWDEARGEGLAREIPHRLERSVVEEAVGGRNLDDGADHAVGLDDELEDDRALQPAALGGRWILERLLDPLSDLSIVRTVLGSHRTAGGQRARWARA